MQRSGRSGECHARVCVRACVMCVRVCHACVCYMRVPCAMCVCAGVWSGGGGGGGREGKPPSSSSSAELSASLAFSANSASPDCSRSRVEGRLSVRVRRQRGGCSGRQTAAGPARRAAARPTWRARSVLPKSPQQPAPQRSRVQVARACRAQRCTHREAESCGACAWLPGGWGW